MNSQVYTFKTYETNLSAGKSEINLDVTTNVKMYMKFTVKAQMAFEPLPRPISFQIIPVWNKDAQFSSGCSLLNQAGEKKLSLCHCMY